MSVGLGGCMKARVFDLTPRCMLQDMEQAPDFTHVPGGVCFVCLCYSFSY